MFLLNINKSCEEKNKISHFIDTKGKEEVLKSVDFCIKTKSPHYIICSVFRFYLNLQRLCVNIKLINKSLDIKTKKL